MKKKREKNITSKAFANFEMWAKGKTFNEILGCAKSNLDGLSLASDVDEYNNNQIACKFLYVDDEGNFALIKVELVMTIKPILFFRNLTEENINDKVERVLAEYEKSDYESLSDYLANMEVRHDYTYEEAFEIYIGCNKAMWGDRYTLHIKGANGSEEVEL